MALFDSTPPYSGQLQTLGNLSAMQGIQNLTAGQTNLAPAQTGQTDLASILKNIGLRTETTGIQELETGMLPESGQTLVRQNLNDQITNIKSKYASLGLSGSTAETEAVTDVQNRSLAQQFTLAGTLGGELAKIGMQGFQLTANTLGSLADEALRQMGIGAGGISGGAGIFQNLAQTQISQDNNMMTTLGNFFKALAGSQGLPGLLPGGASFFGQPGGSLLQQQPGDYGYQG